ncbi:MAG: hypothetical protein AAGD00_01940 [Planctomycetota bacterium]
MSKIIKVLIVLVILVILLIAGVVGLGIFAVSQIDNLAKAAIEQGGTRAMGTQTTVDQVDIGLRAGTFAMSGFGVANPEGFSRTPFLTLADAGVSLDYQSLQGGGQDVVITLPTFTMNDVDINLEKDKGDANYTVILNNIKKTSGSGDGGGQQPTPDEQEQPRFIVNEIDIKDVDIRVDMLPIGGDATVVTLPIERIQLSDVGSDSDKGLLARELVTIVVQAILTEAKNKGAGILPAEILSDLEGQLAQLQDLSAMGVNISTELGAEAQKMLEGVSGEAQQMVDDAAKQAEQAVEDAKKDAEDAIRGLLPGGGG